MQKNKMTQVNKIKFDSFQDHGNLKQMFYNLSKIVNQNGKQLNTNCKFRFMFHLAIHTLDWVQMSLVILQNWNLIFCTEILIFTLCDTIKSIHLQYLQKVLINIENESCRVRFMTTVFQAHDNSINPSVLLCFPTSIIHIFRC